MNEVKHILHAPPGSVSDCPMCEGKGCLVGEGFRRKREPRRFKILFDCMLCDGSGTIDSAIARDYLIERYERIRQPMLEANIVISRLFHDDE